MENNLQNKLNKTIGQIVTVSNLQRHYLWIEIALS